MGYWHRRRYHNSYWVSLLSIQPLSSFSSACNSDKVYIAPSGVQKEQIKWCDIFVLPFPQPVPSPHTDWVFLHRPSGNLKESACTPLFWNAFELRDAGSCIHTHSQNAVMATLLWPGSVFRISHQVCHIPAMYDSFLTSFEISGGSYWSSFLCHNRLRYKVTI
jgi:ribulose-5-phosphate 4-epimerase/fuculose-1-phosphate aldolase